MRRTSCFIFFLLLIFLGKAQINLVPNHDFESFSCCPASAAGTGDLQCSSSWIRVQCSPDYFNQCDVTPNNLSVPTNAFGTQSAHSGVAYAGFYTFNKFSPNANREYIETILTNTLVAGNKYLVSFYVSLADNPQYSTNSIDAYFSTNLISGSNCNRLNYAPQIQNTSANPLTDKNNWVLISDTLYSMGGEQYVTIGNFKTDNLSDTLFLGTSTGWNSSYYYIDDVSVIDVTNIAIEQHSNTFSFTVSPNPTSNTIFLEIKDVSRFQNSTITIQNTLGQTVKKIPFLKTISVSDVVEGCYFLQITLQSGEIYTSKFIKQ